MNNKNISSKDHHIFLLKTLLLLGFAWTGFTMALVGFFYASIAWALLIFGAIWLVRDTIKKEISIKPSRELTLASILFVAITFLFMFFSTPTVFTGRDQGSFAEAGIRLSQNHKLEFSTPTSSEFFKLHEPGRALNFPGFYYASDGNLITQFSLVYISWLALFFSAFGTVGLTIANGVAFFTFLISFYMLARLFLRASSTVPMVLFVCTSFVFMWFSKMTLSENMALPVAWLAITALMLFLKNPRTLSYAVFLLAMSLLCFTRIEGIAFFIVSFAVVFFNQNTRDFIKHHSMKRFFIPMILLAIFFLADMFTDIYFYKEIAKALFPSISLPKATYIGQADNNDLPRFYTLKIFYLYGLLGFFIVGAIGAFTNFWKREFYKLVPFFLVAPTFIYLFDTQISPDHPWMLRRFMFSLLPVAIFYSGLFLGQFFEEKSSDKKGYATKIMSAIVIVILLAMNMPAFSKYLTFSENKNLLSQTQALSSRFSSNDLVLIDQQVSGDGWAMISGPMNFLYGKNAVYFFNIQDLARMNLNDFDNVYLISPNSQTAFYLASTIGNRLTEVQDYNLTTTKLNIEPANPLKKILLPEKKEINISGKIFLIKK